MAGRAPRGISASTVAIGGAVAVAYVAAAELGFRVAFVAEQITTVWPPTGIALAALLLGGLRLWPAVWIGAFLANAGSDAPLWTAFVLATGNTLESVLATWVLRRLPSFDDGLRRVPDVLALIIAGACLCTMVSATIGVATLCAAGEQEWARFATLWFDWWLGDALGALIVAPAILTAARHVWSRRDWVHLALFVSGSVAVTHVVFGQLSGRGQHPLEYVAFPLAIAAAVRGGLPVTSCVVLAVSAVTIWHTVRGSGPFAGQEIHEALVLLQVFMGVLSGTALLVAAAVLERKTSERGERAAAEILREREQMLALAMRGGSMGVWSRNMTTNEVWWSPELEDIVGLPPGSFSRTLEAFEAIVHPDDRAAVRTAVDGAVRRQSDYVVEFRFLHAGGEWRWMEGRGRAVYDDIGTPRTLYGIGIDVTSRKRAEMALREAKQAAESANQLKDQFLATLSHELRTPLNAILGYARMLQTNTIAPDKQPRAFDVIERNAVAQNRLIEDLLDMSRITAGKVRLDPAPIPAATVLREAVDGVKPAADAKAITLEQEIDPFAGTVTADTARLQQVFSNLLTNAVKFTPRGGRVGVALRRDGMSVEICVTDSGVGISPEFLPHIFEPFRQADGRFQRGHGGLGLGLAITKQLVDLHGGTIHAASDGPGQGSTFTVRLPHSAAAVTMIDSASSATAGTSGHETGAPSLAGIQILLVDDEPDTLTMFRDALEGAGARVRAVPDATEALRVTESWRPDLLVSDLGLPGMDGYELLQALRHRSSPHAFPAVAVSAYASMDDRTRALAVGFTVHVAKPIDPAALVRALGSALPPGTRPPAGS